MCCHQFRASQYVEHMSSGCKNFSLYMNIYCIYIYYQYTVNIQIFNYNLSKQNTFFIKIKGKQYYYARTELFFFFFLQCFIFLNPTNGSSPKTPLNLPYEKISSHQSLTVTVASPARLPACVSCDSHLLLIPSPNVNINSCGRPRPVLCASHVLYTINPTPSVATQRQHGYRTNHS